MRDWARWTWIAGGYAASVLGLDWLFGNTTSLLEFAEIMLLSGVFWWSLDLMVRSRRAIRARRRERQDIDAQLRILAVVRERAERAAMGLD